MIVLNVNEKLRMEVEYRHAIFPRIHEILYFFGITETDTIKFLLSYYQNKGVLRFGVKCILAENLYPRKDWEDNSMPRNKNVYANGRFVSFYKDCDEVYTCHTNSALGISHPVSFIK